VADLPNNFWALCDKKEMPTWIPLRSGGGIFVLLDNILVVSPRKDTAEFWLEHIKKNSEAYHAVLKPEKAKAGQPTAPAGHSVITLSEANQDSFTFLGVTWRYNRHHIDLDAEDKDELTVTNGTWSGTRRQLASFLGRIMWYRRVYHRRFSEGLPTPRGVKGLFSLVTPDPAAGQSWNGRMSLDVAHTQVLQEAWNERCRSPQEPCPASPIPTTWTKLVRICTDAAGAPGRDKPLAVVYFPGHDADQGARSATRTRTVVTRANPPLTAKERYEFQVSDDCHANTRLSPAGSHIAVAELLAIHDAVRLYAEEGALIVLATDSQNAQMWIESKRRPFSGRSTRRSRHARAAPSLSTCARQ